jgi:regulator of replication initiation timing
VSSQMRKRMSDLELMMSDLESSFQSLLESHKRLRSRAGMRELRERVSEPETKEQARARIFGNKAGPAFAKQQLDP